VALNMGDTPKPPLKVANGVDLEGGRGERAPRVATVRKRRGKLGLPGFSFGLASISEGVSGQ
jgi:hypothetical protein